MTNSTPERTHTADSIGEGFAFFRWHCLKFPGDFCPGWNGGDNTCSDQWKSRYYR